MRTLLAVLVLVLVLGGCGEDPPATSVEPQPGSASAPSPPSPPTSPSPTPAGSAPVVEAEPAGLDLPAAPAELDRVARAFLRFARGEGGPPVDTPVDLHLGGRFVRTLSNHDAGDRGAWEVCPEGGSYAGRTCPFSAVDRLAETPRVAITSQAPRHPCASPSRLPGAGSGRWVTLQPDAATTCVDWFAVRLLVNDVGQVWRVDLVHAEP